MILKNFRKKLPTDLYSEVIFSWGITVTIAWIATYVLSAYPQWAVINPDIDIMIIWIVLMAIPILITQELFPADFWYEKLTKEWAELMVAGFLINLVALYMYLSVLWLEFSYVHTWFIIGAVGFYITGKNLSGNKRKLYYISAVLNALAIPFFHLTRDVYRFEIFLIAALIQGVPMLIDFWMNWRNS